MKAISLLLSLTLLSLLYAPLQAQENILLSRDFWRSKPSVETIKSKIAEGHSPTEFNNRAFDATSFAILENNSIQTVEFLLSQGNDVNKITHDERPYIFWAASRGNLEMMKYLVSQGARTDLKDHNETSLLMWCASTGQQNTDIYEFCIKNGFDITQEKDRNGRNVALAFARRMQDFSLMDYFISKGVDIHETSNDGNGIFHYAAQTGNLDVLKKLVAKYKVNTGKNAETGENAIHFASYNRLGADSPSQLPVYQYLETLGLDAKLVSKRGRTVLHNLALYSNDTEVIQHFIDKGIDPNHLDENGNTALIYAAQRGDIDKISLLAGLTKDINKANKDGHTAMTRALRSNSFAVVQKLSEKGAKTDLVDKKGYDLGYHLVKGTRGNLKLFDQKMDFLKAQGYDPKSKQQDQSTLLHAAINMGNTALIERLIALGVDVNVKDSNGQTVLHYAAMQSENDKLLKTLIAAGANKNIKTDFEESAYQLASENEMLKANKVNLEFLKTEDQ